jgi:hypothetical protein
MNRLIFVGNDRIVDSIITLKFDHFFNPALNTTTIYLRPDVDILSIYRDHGIDTGNFSVIYDRDLVAKYCSSTNIHEFNGWIAQQMIKLIALDTCPYEEILIQDCDTFLLKPYCYFDQGLPVPLILPNETHSIEYYQYIEKFLGIPRQSTGSYVTEFIPVLKSDWISLRSRIEERYGMRWLEALLKQFRQDQAQGLSLWFAEYEMLGNWMQHLRPDMKTVDQVRFTFSDRVSGQWRYRGDFRQQLSWNSYNSFAIKVYQTENKITLQEYNKLVDYVHRVILVDQ